MIQQTPWIERTFHFNYPVGTYPVIIERLRGTIPRLENLVQGVSEELLGKKRDNSWSIKEQVGHLFDLEELWMGRINDFLSGETVLRAADMTNAKTRSGDHNSKNIGELLSLFKESRKKLIKNTESLDEKKVVVTAMHPRLKTQIRLLDSLYFVAEHDDHHISKIRVLLLSPGS